MKTVHALVKFQLWEDTVHTTQDEKGVYVSALSVSEALGLAHRSFVNRLQRKPWLKTSVVVMTTEVQGDTQTRQILMIPIRKLPMVLATIDIDRCRPEIRAKIELYQNEATEVLADHFLGKRSHVDAHIVEELQAEKRTLIDQVRVLSTTNVELATKLWNKPNEYILCRRNASYLRADFKRIAALRAELGYQRAGRNCVENEARVVCNYFRSPGASWDMCPDSVAQHAISWCDKTISYLTSEKKARDKLKKRKAGQVVIAFPQNLAKKLT